MRPLVLFLTLSPLLGCPPAEDKDSDTEVTDPTGTPTDDTATSVPENAAPTAPAVVISPEHPADGDPLGLTIVTPSTDADGDAITYRTEWSRDGTVDPTLTGDTVSADLTADGDVWSVAVTPNDGTVDGPAGTATVTVGNQPPSAPVVHLEPVAPMAGDDLTLVVDTAAVDPEGAALTQTVTWYRNEVLYGAWADLTTVDGAYVAGGDVFRAVVGVSDGVNPVVTTEASVTVGNHAPVIDGISISPRAPEDADDVQVRVRSSDEDGDTLTTAYAWFVDGVEATDVGDADRVPSDRTSVGETWYVRVTVSDGHDTDVEDSELVTIAAQPLVRYAHYLEAVATDGDDNGTWDDLAGEWRVLLQTEGAKYGHTDCDAYYEIASTGTFRCPGCLFAFDTTITYDAASSTMNTPAVCSFFAVDGTGQVSIDRDGSMEFYAYGPGIGVYYYGTPYSFGPYMYFYAYGNYAYKYPGYVMSMSISAEEDTAGLLQVTASQYMYRSY